MRGLIGFIIFLAAVATLHSVAESEIKVRCAPVEVPEQTHCYPVLGEPFTKRPYRCRVA